MERRYSDDAQIVYHDVQTPGVREENTALLDEIDKRGLIYPVTVIDGVPAYDGAVSYPAIMRAVNNKLLEREAPVSD
jgi:disulfide oxidoreductase YuzD